MIHCILCNSTSPNDAKFCIECGKPITTNAYVEGTKRLSNTNTNTNILPHGKIYGKDVYLTLEEALELRKDVALCISYLGNNEAIITYYGYNVKIY